MIVISNAGRLHGDDKIGAYCNLEGGRHAAHPQPRGRRGRHNVRVNCTAPGLVKTDFAYALWKIPAIAERTANLTTLKRLGDPDNLAGAV